MARLRPTHSRGALGLLCAAHFALVLDVTIVNVALPTIERDLAISPAALHWVVGAYALAFGGALVVGGRIADRMGHRAALATGMAVFAAASVACAFAPSVEALVAARVLQGLGAALADPAALGMLAAVFPHGGARDRALATWATITALAAVTGLIAGGALTELLSWEWIFLVNAPLGIAVPALALLLLPGGGAGRAAAFDVRGAVLASAAVIALAAALGTVSGAGTIGASSLGLLGSAAMLALAFHRHERRSDRPLIPRRLLGDPQLAVTLLTGAIGGALVLGSFLLLPLALERELGLTPLETGLALLATRAPSMVWASVVRRLLAAAGPGATSMLGMGLLLIAELSFTQMGVRGLAGVLPGLALVGLAIPCVFMSTSRVALRCAAPHEAGLASGLLSAAQWLGGGVGLAVVALGTPGDLDGATTSLAAGFWTCAGVSVAGIGASAALVLSARRGGVAPAPA